MKAKYILLSILCISICTTAEAQILKKLKKKAQQAAERTLIKKTEELVTGTTEKTIDDVTTGNEKTTESENTTEVENTADVENTTEVEKSAYRDAAEHSGAKEVYMIHQSCCAAEGLEILFTIGNFILVDFGACKIEITIFASSLPVST